MSTKQTPAKRLAATTKKAPKGDLKKQMAENATVIQKGKKNSKAKDGNFLIIPKEAEIIKPSERPINEIIREKITFEGGGVKIDPTLTPQECLSAISFFGEFETVSNRAIGQLIVFAEAKYGDDTYAAIIKATGMKSQSLQNIASTVRRIPEELWNDKLDFTHHTAVAALPDAQKKKLLNRAEKEGLSSKQLKREVAIVAPPKPRPAKASANKTDNTVVAGTLADWEMSKEAIEKDEKALEHADKALLYFKSKAFGDINAKARDAWKSLLMQFSDAYEKLLRA